jgi:acyl-CoA thioester hydrolase
MRWHELEYRVMLFEVDAWGVVWHGHYIKWFERGRTELLRPFGLAVSDLEQLGVVAPVTEAHCEYKHPARCDDLVIIRTTIEPPTKAMLVFRYEILRACDRLLLARGETSQVLLSREGKMLYLLPAEIEKRIKAVVESLRD